MQVKIIDGKHGNHVIRNEVYTAELLRGSLFRQGQDGTFILVDGTSNPNYLQRKFRIKVSHTNVIVNYTNDEAIVLNPAPENKAETYEDIKERITERFNALIHLTTSVCEGTIRGLIVSGPPGIGKTYEVKNVFTSISEENFDVKESEDASRIGSRFSIVAGRSTAAALYELLFDHKEAGQVLAIDDCDAVFGDEDALNLLKAAMDTSDERIVSWRVSSATNKSVPSSFKFEGSVIFLTNLDFTALIEKDNRLSKHLSAIQDRCLVLDLDMYSTTERLARIEQVIETGFLKKNGINTDEQFEVFEFFKTNIEKFNGITMRRVVQLASIYKSGGDWKKMAAITLFKKGEK